MSPKDQSASYIRSLCVGVIEEDLLFPYPHLKKEEAETVKSVTDAIGDLLGGKDEEFRRWDVDGEMPAAFLNEMKEFGLFSLIVPEEHGGMGLSNTAYARCLQEMAKFDGSVAITAGAHSSIGMKGLLLFGTPEQKQRYLPKLAIGEMIAAFCLTEAGAGSDAASIRTKAVKDGNDWILTGEKIWITNGGIADFFTVFAITGTDEGKMTAFIVTRDMKGVSTSPHEDKMGLRASSTTTVRFDGVRIPPENVLGPVGKGFKVAVSILNNGRTGLGGGCVGAMKHLISMSSRQAKMRQQFGRSIAEFGLVKQKLGQMMVDCYVTESVVNMVAGTIDSGAQDYAVEAAISKVLATDALWRTADEALQIAGGNGFMREFPYERILRDCRVNRIFEGTNEILNLFIALTGISDATTQLKEVGALLENPRAVLADPIKGFGVFAEYSKKLIGAYTPYGAPRMTKAHASLGECVAVVESHTRFLATLADKLLRRHGKKIVEKQLASRRMAQVMIDLYALSCVISRVTDSIARSGADAAAAEVKIARTFSHQVDERIRAIAQKMDANDDEWVKELGDLAVANEGYGWDNLL